MDLNTCSTILKSKKKYHSNIYYHVFKTIVENLIIYDYEIEDNEESDSENGSAIHTPYAEWAVLLAICDLNNIFWDDDKFYMIIILFYDKHKLLNSITTLIHFARSINVVNLINEYLPLFITCYGESTTLLNQGDEGVVRSFATQEWESFLNMTKYITSPPLSFRLQQQLIALCNKGLVEIYHTSLVTRTWQRDPRVINVIECASLILLQLCKVG
jgi:hypothetical protein